MLLHEGMKGKKVRQLQKDLKELGFYNDLISGVYDEKTFASVFLFQDAVDIQVDGIVGPQTIEAINVMLSTPEYKRFIVIVKTSLNDISKEWP